MAAPRGALLALSVIAFMLPAQSLGQDDVSDETPVMVVDLHVDVPWQVHFKGRGDDLAEGHARISALRAGNYGAIVFPIYLPDSAHSDGAHIEDADAIYETIGRIVAKNRELLPLRSPAAEPGRITTFLAIEGAGAFARDPAQIDRFVARGVRLVGLAHAKNNALASSATGEKVETGLSPLGRDFCHRLYGLGALVDVSHLSDASFADLVPIATQHGAPIVATHSNARAVAKHPRNLTDEQLRAIAATGGVAGLNFHGPFVKAGGKATIADLLAQLDHMIGVAGIDHVAIGSDFDGGIHPPEGLDDASALPKLAARLRKRGMPYGEVLKIFSQNALRVLAWRKAEAAPATNPR